MRLPLRHRPIASPSGEITDCFGCEGTSKAHPVQPPCGKQGHLQVEQIAQSPKVQIRENWLYLTVLKSPTNQALRYVF